MNQNNEVSIINNLVILLVEDEPQFAQWALQEIQSQCTGFEVHVASDLRSARQRLQTHDAQGLRMAIVDLHLGEDRGIELIKELSHARPDVPVLVLTTVNIPSEALVAIQSGARGYVIKSTVKGELSSAVQQVLGGGAPINPGIAAHLLGVFRKLAHADASAPDPIELALGNLDTKLSSRESEVLKLVARGYSDKEVAANLLIAKSTVDTHVRAIFRKFSVHSRAQLRRTIGC
jgi:DNA-binding NarL/FixJ family response regulator